MESARLLGMTEAGVVGFTKGIGDKHGMHAIRVGWMLGKSNLSSGKTPLLPFCRERSCFLLYAAAGDSLDLLRHPTVCADAVRHTHRSMARKIISSGGTPPGSAESVGRRFLPAWCETLS